MVTRLPEAALETSVSNEWIAGQLDAVANLLEEQGANQYRVQAWRNGASTMRRLAQPAGEILRNEGIEGLDRLPGIGAALSRAIREMLETGRLTMLERLRGEREPVSLLATVPGVGEGLAERLHETLGINTLEELEGAAHDGRLASVPGFGPKRIAGISEALATRLRARRRSRQDDDDRPSVAELLDVDREYRQAAAAEKLPTIAPRRFNPEGERWLPVLHTTRGDRHYTALFSNTALAHRVGRTHDWVVLYFDGKNGERQATVVTGLRGALAGRRVVRGRESECLSYYQLSTAA
jgi:DNA polymerase (family 10)